MRHDNEIFRKDVTYDIIKIKKKTGPHRFRRGVRGGCLIEGGICTFFTFLSGKQMWVRVG